MTLNEIIAARRSVRAYKDTPIAREAIEEILNAGRLAPSARNSQAWHFTVVESKDKREAMKAACCDQEMVAEAAASIVVWACNDRMMDCGQSATSVDCSIALSFMMLKATELGLGTCWLGAFENDKVKAVLNLPSDAVVVAVTPLGYAAETPKPRPRKALSEISDIV